MTDEERQRQIDFIIEQQAQFAVNMELLREAQARTDATLAQMVAQQAHMNEVVAVIADGLQRTDERLSVLIGVVERHITETHGGAPTQ